MSPQGGNETEIMLRARYSGYGGMKLDPMVIERDKIQNPNPFLKNQFVSPSHLVNCKRNLKKAVSNFKLFL